METYIRREAIAPIARRRTRAARRQANARKRKGQLSVLIDSDTLARFRAYVASRQDEDEPMSMAHMVEDLLEWKMRRSRKGSK